jgi:hypothetical protein
MFGFVVYAEDNKTQGTTTTTSTIDSYKLKKEEANKKLLENKGKIQLEKEQFKKEKESVKNELEVKKEENKKQVELMLQSIKEKREQFKTEMEATREQTKLKVEEMKTGLKENLKNIKDESKRISAEKIITIIQDLNTKLTTNFFDKIVKIENVLVSIESRISKAQDRGIDVSSLAPFVEKSKEAIKIARDAVTTQSQKVYTLNSTTDTTLKSQMKALRDTFTKDIKEVGAKVKLAHEAVQKTAVALAKISKIDGEDTSNKVESNTTSSN